MFRWVGWLLRFVLFVFILAVPLSGAWLASSWAAYANGPLWLVVLCGALFFPILPVSWELWAERRRRRRLARQRESTGFFGRLRQRSGKRWTRFSDRVFFRTLVINGLFVAFLVKFAPGPTLTAVGARGDWIFDNMEGPVADAGRSGIRWMADSLQAFNGDFTNNRWAAEADVDDGRLPTPDEIGEAAPVRREQKTVSVRIALPVDATGQVDTHRWTGTDTLTLPLGATSVSVTFEDGRRLRCPLEPGEGDVDLAEDTLGSLACTEIVGANPTWRPEIRMESRWFSKLPRFEGLREDQLEGAKRRAGRGFLEGDEVLEFDGDRTPFVLGPVIVAPDAITAVVRNDPWIRVEVAPEARQRLCSASKAARGKRVVALVDGRVRYARIVSESLCDGFIPLDGERPIQTDFEDAGRPDAGSGTSGWPYEATPHPLSGSVPADVASSIRSLGAWIRDNTGSEEERARVIHDWIVTRVSYHHESLEPGKRAPQDADTVFRRQTGVCAGYANLFVAISRAANLEAVYITGNVRDSDGELAGMGHAWNAVKVDGKWLLVDPTWNSGSKGSSGTFEFSYDTAYLFAPPSVFRKDHLPEEPAWQLSRDPISRGDFLRQDLMTVRAEAMGLRLTHPTAPQIQTAGPFRVTFDNPNGVRVMAKLDGASCKVSPSHLDCPAPTGSTGQLKIFAKPKDDAGTWYPYVGRIIVQRG